MNTLETLSYNIVTIRTSLHYTQAVLAEKAGITRKHLLNIEKGRILPSAYILDNLAKALGVPVGDLFQDPGSKEKTINEINQKLNQILVSKMMTMVSEVMDDIKEEL